MSSSVETQSQVASVASTAANTNTSTTPSRVVEGTHLPLEPPVVINELPSDFDAVDAVFDRRHQSSEEQEDLPPYIEEPPAYTASGSNEPMTLAMYLFKFGFLFPPFWIIGAFILLSPLREPESTPSSVWLPEKSAEERGEIIQKMRKAEVKWAKRCLVALCIFLALAVAAALTIWGVLRS